MQTPPAALSSSVGARCSASAERTSFQKVLREVRAVLAVNYLRDERLKALEVAMLLGYSNISAFTTAFKSWYDMPRRRSGHLLTPSERARRRTSCSAPGGVSRRTK